MLPDVGPTFRNLAERMVVPAVSDDDIGSSTKEVVVNDSTTYDVPSSWLHVTPLASSDMSIILQEWMERDHFRLTMDQHAYLVKQCEVVMSPLFLRMAYDHAKLLFGLFCAELQ